MRFSGEPIKFYNAASSEVFGDINGAAADEVTPFSPRSPDAVAKATAVWEVANYWEADGLFACSGILFNHDSPLRPERFVTQKIVASAVRIAAGTQDQLYLGNIDIQRDWGWAEGYVEAMYLMLQQEQSDDYVIATGESYKLAEIYPPPPSLRDATRTGTPPRRGFITRFRLVGLDWREYVVSDRGLCRPTDLAGSNRPINNLEIWY
jgi:GDPmannose 4,6-dehydratase